MPDSKFKKSKFKAGQIGQVFGRSLLPILLLFAASQLLAQDDNIVCPDSTFCVPSVPGMPRSKAIVFNYEYLPGYGIESKSNVEGLPETKSQVGHEERFEVKVRFPLWLSDKFRAAIGFHYFNEDFIFKSPSEEYPLQQQLNDHNLKSLGARLFFSKSWKGKSYFMIRISADLNGDFDQNSPTAAEYLKLSFAPMYGRKLNDNTSIGGGVAWAHNFGRPSIIPFFVLNHTVNNRWGIEAILPAMARVRVNASTKDILYAGLNVEGASYSIHPTTPAFDEEDLLQLRTSELRAHFTYEREIHDWLWARVQVGGRFSLNFELTDNEVRNPTQLVKSEREPAVFMRTGIFLVPPRKFLD